MEALAEHETDKLRFSGVKFQTDGSFPLMGSRVNFPGYLDGTNGQTADSDLVKNMLPFWKAGRQLHVHANGDKALDDTLDALAALQELHPRFDHRYTVEHYSISNPMQARRLKALGGIASGNCYFVHFRGLLHETHAYGPDRSDAVARLGTLEREGVTFALHAAYPQVVVPMEPLTAAYTAVTRPLCAAPPSARVIKGPAAVPRCTARLRTAPSRARRTHPGPPQSARGDRSARTPGSTAARPPTPLPRRIRTQRPVAKRGHPLRAGRRGRRRARSPCGSRPGGAGPHQHHVELILLDGKPASAHSDRTNEGSAPPPGAELFVRAVSVDVGAGGSSAARVAFRFSSGRVRCRVGRMKQHRWETDESAPDSRSDGQRSIGSEPSRDWAPCSWCYFSPAAPQPGRGSS